MLMDKRLVNDRTYVKASPIHGFGVFAKQGFEPGVVIEECTFLLSETNHIDYSNYVFSAGDGNKVLLLLGSGSLYNHSDDNNAMYQQDIEKNVIVIKRLNLSSRMRKFSLVMVVIG